MFQTENELSEHKKQTHKIFQCQQCEQAFWAETDLNDHTYNEHRHKQIRQNFGDYVIDDGNVEFEDDEDEDIFEPEPNEETDEEEEPIQAKRTRKTSKKDDIIKCPECEMTFMFKSGLNSHKQNMHTGDKACDICNYRTYSDQKLDNHKELHMTILDSSFEITADDIETSQASTAENDTNVNSEQEETHKRKSDTLITPPPKKTKKRKVTMAINDSKPQCHICNLRLLDRK